MPTPAFIRHASTEAIEAALTKARASQARWTREVVLLEDLLTHRTAQIEAGTWPEPAPTVGMTRVCRHCWSGIQRTADPAGDRWTHTDRPDAGHAPEPPEPA